MFYYIVIRARLVGLSGHTAAGLSLTQKKYSLDLLRRAVMLKCKPITTPKAMTEKLSVDIGVLLSSDDATEYPSIVGGL